MQISENLKEAVKDFVASKSLKQMQSSMPSKGLVKVEYRFNLCYNPKVLDKVFVVSEIMKYQSQSLSDKKYGIYAFDINSGQEIKNFGDSDDCYFGIVNDLRVIERIL